MVCSGCFVLSAVASDSARVAWRDGLKELDDQLKILKKEVKAKKDTIVDLMKEGG